MGQREVFDALSALGGRAKMDAIIALTIKNNPNLKRHAVWHSMRGLRSNEYVAYDWKSDEYVAVVKFPEPNLTRIHIARTPIVESP